MLFDWNEIGENMTAEETYGKITKWALRARRENPGVFDVLSAWVLNDSEWGVEKLAENEKILMQGVLARFKEQNARLRECLKEIEPSGVVNEAVFGALDRFDDELSGKPRDERLRETVAKVFADFSAMCERGVREKIAGYSVGSKHMTDMGYINYLKDCDAGVQWTLFMPDFVKNQLNGFKVDSFEYREFPAMRFIGFEGEEYADIDRRVEKMHVLDAMQEYKSGFDYDILFMHHYGLSVDNNWHGVWGRFMKADAPVPEGFISFDFVPHDVPVAGSPYYSRFAFASFSGDMDAMHSREGFDSDAMYDVTRNIILGEGVDIPYPEKYWTAEVFFDGCDKYSTGYLFSVGL